jgi:nitrite reductase/ring-hydroxylating ferredoxin subunit
MNTTRRKLIMGLGSALLLTACERHKYIREKEQRDAELDLGPVKDLLYNQTHIPLKSVLMFRDIDGWSCLSTRCTYEGCDLTYQEPILLCSCCHSTFDINSGLPHTGSHAARPLPWLEMSYREGHLYAHPGKPVDRKWRFTTPDIEEAVRKLKIQVREEGVESVKIPKALMGQRGLDDEEPMFLESQPKYAPSK